MRPVIVHISIPNFYHYNGWDFEWSRNKPFSPWPIKKDGELRKRAGDKFYNDISGFFDLTKEEQEECRI